ncbi:MAG TPA: SPFH domain-containing protein [Acidobacteriota bacterium]|nr:SPFH domain-containing protein [Acidobacteriota bacterium]
MTELNDMPHDSATRTAKKTYFPKKYIAIGAAAVAAVSSYVCGVIVDEREHAIIESMGKPTQVIYNPLAADEKLIPTVRKSVESQGAEFSLGPGLYWKKPWESVRRVDRRLQLRPGLAQHLTTGDKTYLYVDSVAIWTVQDPLQFAYKVGTISNAQSRLDDILDSQTNTRVSSIGLMEILRSENRKLMFDANNPSATSDNTQQYTVKIGRTQVEKQILDASQPQLAQLGVALHHEHGAILRNVGYRDDVKASIESRMQSERAQMAEKIRGDGRTEAQKIRSESKAEAAQIRGEAIREAEARKGQADAYELEKFSAVIAKDPSYYEFKNRLDLLSHLPNQTQVILTTDSELAKLLKGAKH